jgi:hypothetical protein
MEVHGFQIGTSIAGVLGPQNQVTRKMKPILSYYSAITNQFNEGLSCLGLQADLARILILSVGKIFRSYQKG